MSLCKIRQAVPQDGKRLAEIEGICFPPLEAASPETVLERMQVFLENFVVAEVDGDVVGFINGCNTDQPYLPDTLYHDVHLHLPEGDYQTVFGLNVLPQYRKQGIAKLLVERYIQVAKERNRKGIILTCKDHMVHYYQKFGFKFYGVSDSEHGGQKWNDMRLEITKE